MSRVQLGQKVRDVVSGFVGIATSRTEWLNGCVRIGVDPKSKKAGELPDGKVFDEQQLQVVDETPIVLPAKFEEIEAARFRSGRRAGGGRPDRLRRVDPR